MGKRKSKFGQGLFKRGSTVYQRILDNIHIQPRDYTANINHIQVITCNTMETMKVVKSILDGNP